MSDCIVIIYEGKFVDILDVVIVIIEKVGLLMIFGVK